ncbi:MAG: phosphomannomutase/phosphoglucomutase [Spirochaetes bacterium]|nr:phosphomannomutase/phosphoglucomutase [Spirochaetota bacterium]
MGIYKAYDIRGIYNKDFNKDDVYKIGYFIPKLLKTDKILVGHDGRLSSDEIFYFLSEGITDSGADVYSCGYSTTPMIYFGTSYYNFKGSVQITASHNPKEYNGFKISGENSVPIGYDNGLNILEKMVREEKLEISKSKGKIFDFNVLDDYKKYLNKFIENYEDLNISVDLSNGMASIIVKDLFPTNFKFINDFIDGNFPAHEPNPLEEENRKQIVNEVVKNKSDLGIIFDGDADRVMFIDDKGNFIQPDYLIALISEFFFSERYRNKLDNKTILCDIRTSKSTIDYIKKLGGNVYLWKVGHAYAKKKLKELNSVFGGELAGHYYFKDFFYCDSGILASIIVLNELNYLRKNGLTISEKFKNIIKYFNSGEINFKVENKLEIMEKIKNYFISKEDPVNFYDFDGFRVEFKDWWFNIRPSNTEPYLRLIVEASNKDILNEKIDKINDLIKSYN